MGSENSSSGGGAIGLPPLCALLMYTRLYCLHIATVLYLNAIVDEVLLSTAHGTFESIASLEGIRHFMFSHCLPAKDTGDSFCRQTENADTHKVNCFVTIFHSILQYNVSSFFQFLVPFCIELAPALLSHIR